MAATDDLELSLLEDMVAAALDAGRATMTFYGTGVEVHTKADRSPVTAADHAAEAIIVDRLHRSAPKIPVVAEEGVASGVIPAVGRTFFLVDPLDGTKEFIGQRGDFTVNIALIVDRTPVLGVVFAPARQLLFSGDVARARAERWSRADEASPWTRGVTQTRATPPQGLTAVASRSHRTPETDTFLGTLPVAETVSVGSSLKFCLVASGQADIYPRFGPTMEWDTAAGHAVLAAAGGSVLDVKGAPLLYGKEAFRNGSFIAYGTRR